MVPPTQVALQSFFAGIDDGSRSAHHQPRSPFRLGDHGDTCPRRLARAFFQDQWVGFVACLRRTQRRRWWFCNSPSSAARP
jgi:hypothetical protein